MAADPAALGLPTRESEAREWIEAAVMLLTKDGVDVVLIGHESWGGLAAGSGFTQNVAGPVRVVGDLEGLRWTAEQSFDVDAGGVVEGAEVRTPEGMLLARPRLERQPFPSRGTYHLRLEIDFYNFPLS